MPKILTLLELSMQDDRLDICFCAFQLTIQMILTNVKKELVTQNTDLKKKTRMCTIDGDTVQTQPD